MMKSLIPWKRSGEERGGVALAERPQEALTQMRRELDSLFDRFFGGWPTWFGGDWPMMHWGLDVDDKANELVVHADAPGFEPDEFNVEMVGDNLILSAEHKEEKKGDGHRYQHGRFYRKVALPHGVDAERIEARYHNGVLEIHVPKGEGAKGKRIPVTAA